MSEPGDVDVWENEDAKLVTQVTGKPEPIVEWFHGFKKLAPSSDTAIMRDGKTHSLLLKERQIEDSGTITVTATNKAGTCTAESKLTVQG